MLGPGLATPHPTQHNVLYQRREQSLTVIATILGHQQNVYRIGMWWVWPRYWATCMLYHDDILPIACWYPYLSCHLMPRGERDLGYRPCDWK